MYVHLLEENFEFLKEICCLCFQAVTREAYSYGPLNAYPLPLCKVFLILIKIVTIQGVISCVVCYSQIAVPDHVFLFDVLTMGRACFEEGVKDVLESKDILKVKCERFDAFCISFKLLPCSQSATFQNFKKFLFSWCLIVSLWKHSFIMQFKRSKCYSHDICS